MRDYKFSHSGLDFDKPKRPVGRWLLRIAIMAVVAVGAYLAYVSIDWSETETTLPVSDDPNVIPLEIPPYNAPDAPAADGKVGAVTSTLPSVS